MRCRLTDRASAAATAMLGHYLTFITPEATGSCRRLLGCQLPMIVYSHGAQYQDSGCECQKIPECESNRSFKSNEVHTWKQRCCKHYGAVRCERKQAVRAPPLTSK
jgi:hypothetical protein